MSPAVLAPHEEQVQAYYDRNTQRFLRLGASRKELSIHRAVWVAGVRTRSAALETSSRLILADLENFASRLAGEPVHILDLGCGVGGTLFFLARNFPGPLKASGITLSPLQARLAMDYARQLKLDGICTFHTGSYLDLPPLPPADLAIGVESFSLGPDPARFFRSAASALRPGGRLLLIDDFLSSRAAAGMVHPRQHQWISAFQKGWHANSLLTPQQVSAFGGQAGLHLDKDRDLTPFLHLLTLRDCFVALILSFGRLLPLRALLTHDYLDSLRGGNALQHGLRKGIFEYHQFTFTKS
ncbi:MAG: methyltransferase domain-containing protein [Anaerolineaceae bacterium]|nr:methyltransferase domain-containing protein [Anaerolineaceae bacterium]